MSEMLGNQYFMARNYPLAQIELEEALQKNPLGKQIRKKLIICYTQTSKIKEALKLFTELIKEDIEFITNTDAVKDDCPCPDLVEQIEQTDTHLKNSVDYYIVLGIIWLYCDVNKSLPYFEKANMLFPGNKQIIDIIDSIKL